MTASGAARHLQPRLGVVAGAGEAAEAEFAKDRWGAGQLGIGARRGRDVVKFTGISQPWLREAVKEWSRFRLGAGYAFGTIEAAAQNMTRFSTFLSTRPEVVDHTGITRELLEKFLLWMLTSNWSTRPPVEHRLLREGVPRVGTPTPHPARSARRRDHLRRRGRPT